MPQHRAAVRAQQRDCGLVTVRQTSDFDPGLVTIDQCSFGARSFDLNGAGSEVDGYTEWANENPTEGDRLHAFIRAQVMLDGQTMPLNVDTDHQYRRQPDGQTYEIMVGPETVHWVDWAIPTDSIPVGQDMPVQVNPLVIEHRYLDQW